VFSPIKKKGIRGKREDRNTRLSAAKEEGKRARKTHEENPLKQKTTLESSHSLLKKKDGKDDISIGRRD